MGFNPLAIFSTGPAEQAAQDKIDMLKQGYSQLSDLYGQGRSTLTDYYTRALQPWQSLQGAAGGGYQAYADATGANGPEGMARARAQFQSSPGFDFQLNTGVDALARARAAAGGATGNTLQDALKYGTGLAQQDWGNYVSRLQPFLQQGDVVAGGIAGIDTGLGSNLATSMQNQGTAANTMFGQVGDTLAQKDLAAYNASGNLVNLGLNALKAISGGSGLFTSLGGPGGGNPLRGGMGLPGGGAPGGMSTGSLY